MKRPMTSVRDPETHKRILREMNDEEFAQWEIDKAWSIEEKERLDAKKQEKKVKANKLINKLAALNSIDLTKAEIAELLSLEI